MRRKRGDEKISRERERNKKRMNIKEQKTKKKTCSLALNGKRFKLYSCTHVSPHTRLLTCVPVTK